MLNIYYGRENIDKEKFISSRINKKERTFILVPDQFTLEFERDLMENMGVSALMNVEVLSMSRFGSRLLDENGGDAVDFIDKYGRHMILSKILKDEKENLSTFKGMDGKVAFLEMLNDFISELKQYNVTPDEVVSLSKSTADEGLKKKLADLGYIYNKYEEKIQGKYTDSEGYIDLYIKKISESNLVKNSKFWVYGFDSFAPKAMNIVTEIAKYSKDTGVILIDSENKSEKDHDLFTLSEIIRKNFEKEADTKGIDFTAQPIPNKESFKAEMCKASEILERNLYAFPSEKINGNCDSLTLVKATNVYYEAENAACYILKLLREQKYKLSDIKVIVNDDKIAEITQRIFAEYGIEAFKDNTRSIRQNPSVATAISLIDVLINNYDSRKLFKLLKLGFLDDFIAPENVNDELSKFEKYINEYKIEHNCLENEFTKCGEKYKDKVLQPKYDVAHMNVLRESIKKPFDELDKIMKSKTYGQFIDLYKAFLEDTVKIRDSVAKFELGDNEENAFDAFLGILDQIKRILGDEALDKNELFNLIQVGTKDITIGVLPPTKDGIFISNIERTRIGHVKVLVVIGVNENVIPKEMKTQGILSGDEKLCFKEDGIEVLKTDSVILQEERLAIYRNLVKPGEKLYLSYSIAKEDGTAARKSGIFTKVESIFKDVKVVDDAVTEFNKKELLGNNTAGLRHLAEALERSADESDLDEDTKYAIAWYEENDKEALEMLDRGLNFNAFKDKIDKTTAHELYKSFKDDVISLSPSRLEMFSRCPFEHFVSYGLNPDKDDVYEIQANDVGNICHNAMKAVSQSIDLSDTDKLTDDDISKNVDDKTDEERSNYKEGLFENNPENKYRLDRIKKMCTDACVAMVKQVKAGTINKGVYEVGFGREKKLDPITVNADGETVYVEGRIDRVDYLPNDRVKIVDYKTSGNEQLSVDEALSGFKLQLMIYLKAAKDDRKADSIDKKPAGVFYFNIPDKNIDKNYTPDKIEKERLKKYKLSGIFVNDDMVIKSIDRDYNGRTPIMPTTASKGALTAGEFKRFEELFNEKLTELANDLVKGDVEIRPLRNDKNTPCTYCKYKGICRFDTLRTECEFTDIKKGYDLTEETE